MSRSIKIRPENIRLDGDTQPRAKILPATCAEYAERMRAGDKFPPVVVYYDGQNYWLVDGFHRYQAHLSVWPGRSIDCEVRQGARDDAQWYSYGVNKIHGLPRSNEDKSRAVQLALAHPKSRGLSDRQIAAYCGVSPATVGNYRRSCSGKDSASSSPVSTKPTSPSTPAETAVVQPMLPRMRTGRDGRTINTANIGKWRKTLLAGETTTAVSMPQNPMAGARRLIETFDHSYLRALTLRLSLHLKERDGAEEVDRTQPAACNTTPSPVAEAEARGVNGKSLYSDVFRSVSEGQCGEDRRIEDLLARALLCMKSPFKLALLARIVEQLSQAHVPGNEAPPWHPEIREAEVRFGEAAQKLVAHWRELHRNLAAAV